MFTDAVLVAKPGCSKMIMNKLIKKERPFLLPGDSQDDKKTLQAMQRLLLNMLAVQGKITQQAFSMQW